MRSTQLRFRDVSRVIVAAFLCLPMLLPTHPALGAVDIRALYDKTDVRIPMRDGVQLYTVIFSPKDTGKSYPILFNRTPYSVPYGPDNFPSSLGPSPRFAESGYIFVYQDVRGQFMSEGTYVNMRPELEGSAGPRDIDESTDTYDTIDWLVKHLPHNNGRVGMWGISYPGFYAACGAIRSHPALKAVSPQAPIADWFIGDDDHHNGAFYLMDNFDWDYATSFDTPRSGPTPKWPAPLGHFDTNNAYQFYMDLGPLKNANTRYFKGKIPFWNELMEHSNYDSYWQSRNLLPHFHTVKPAMLIVGGWFDAEDPYGPLAIYNRIRQTSPGTPMTLVEGPWPHGGWSRGSGDHFGDIAFEQKTGQIFRDTVEYPFFEYYLRGGDAPPLPNALVFETGSNHWRAYDAWPPRDLKPKNLYFHADGKLSFEPPTGPNAFDSYQSDPSNPVPYSAAATKQAGRNNLYMIEDQRFLSDRQDLLSYRSEPLPREVTLDGPMQAKLYVALTGADADFVVKLIDVYPDSAEAAGSAKLTDYQMLVRAQVMRGKFRHSFQRPEPFTPGEITPVEFTLLDVAHTFKAGHRIMVQVQSSWFPIVDRNPQTFIDIAKADASNFQKETIRIYRSPRYPSSLKVGSK